MLQRLENGDHHRGDGSGDGCDDGTVDDDVSDGYSSNAWMSRVNRRRMMTFGPYLPGLHCLPLK